MTGLYIFLGICVLYLLAAFYVHRMVWDLREEQRRERGLQEPPAGYGALIVKMFDGKGWRKAKIKLPPKEDHAD